MGAQSAKTPTASLRPSELAPELARPRQTASFGIMANPSTIASNFLFPLNDTFTTEGLDGSEVNERAQPDRGLRGRGTRVSHVDA
jgi:hypothetical protein